MEENQNRIEMNESCELWSTLTSSARSPRRSAGPCEEFFPGRKGCCSHPPYSWVDRTTFFKRL